MARLRTSALISMASQGTMLAVAFVRMAVVSRLLTPSEIGVFALASALMVLTRIIRIFGTWDYIVAQKEITTEILRTCFTLLVLMALTMTTLFIFGADWLAGYLDAPDLRWLAPMMSVSFLVLSLGLVAQATMSREMRFGQLSIVRITAGISDASLAVLLVVLGFGVESLAWGFVFAAFVSTGLIAFFEPRKILFRPSFHKMGEIIRFGGVSSLGAALNTMAEFGPTLLLGRLMDTASIGYYGRGQTLVSIIRQGIETTTAPVTQTWFAQKSRSDESELAEGYMKITGLLSAVTWPAYIFIIFNAATLVPFLLGEQWLPSVAITQALAIGAMFSAFSVYGMSLMVGTGQVGRRLQFNLVDQSIRFAMLGFAVQWGLHAFALAMGASFVVSFFLVGFFLRRDIQLSLRALVLSLTPSALLALPVAAVNLIAQEILFQTTRLGFWEFMGVTFASGIAWLVTLIALKHPLKDQAMDIIKIRRARAKSS